MNLTLKLPPGQQTVVSGVAPKWHQKFTGQVSLLVAEQNKTWPFELVAGCPIQGLSNGWQANWQARLIKY